MRRKGRIPTGMACSPGVSCPVTGAAETIPGLRAAASMFTVVRDTSVWGGRSFSHEEEEVTSNLTTLTFAKLQMGQKRIDRTT